MKCKIVVTSMLATTKLSERMYFITTEDDAEAFYDNSVVKGKLDLGYSDSAQKKGILEKSKITNSLPVNHVKQQNYYYCRPTLAKKTLDYLGYGKLQDDMLKTLGKTTNGTNVEKRGYIW